MKNLLLSLNLVVLVAGCLDSTGLHSPPAPVVAPSAGPSNSAQPAAAVAAPVKTEFSVPASARGLVGGADTISRRTSGYRFQSDQVPKLMFAKPEVGQVTADLRATAQRFFAAGGAGQVATRLPSAVLDPESPLWQLATGDPLAVAAAVPESGAVVLQRRTPWKDQTPIRDASEAVSAALSAIADNQLLNPSAGETLDVVGIHARFMGITDASSASQNKVGYKVLFGRVYGGVPVHGPTTSVGLDSTGKISLFRRGWREIASAEGSLAVAPESVIDSRRDPLQAHFLTQQEVNCGYVEDDTTSAVQEGPGLGCAYGYLDPSATDGLSKQLADWVNAAADPSLPLRGVVPH